MKARLILKEKNTIYLNEPLNGTKKSQFSKVFPSTESIELHNYDESLAYFKNYFDPENGLVDKPFSSFDEQMQELEEINNHKILLMKRYKEDIRDIKPLEQVMKMPVKTSNLYFGKFWNAETGRHIENILDMIEEKAKHPEMKLILKFS